MSEEMDRILTYHQATKHHFGRFARGPGRLDWATQPDPFRRYHGSRKIDLERIPPSDHPAYELGFAVGRLPPQPLNRATVSQLFFDSLALSAWKQAGDVTWSLRVNPSSGNLHPTEGYLICGPIEGLTASSMIAHYAPREHALEVRAEFPLEFWQTLSSDLPAGAVLVGLSSIHWREAWKYGERAFRYCQHDVGHAIGAISLAAAGLGWQTALLDELGTEQLAYLLGISDPQGAEAEHPDCLLVVYPQDQTCPRPGLPGFPLAELANVSWQGQPNQLSPRHARWPIIDEAATATVKSPTKGLYDRSPDQTPAPPAPVASQGRSGDGSKESLSLRRIIRQRRSAVAMDGRGSIGRDTFFQILRRTLPGVGRIPFNALPWRPLAHLALFVHRVAGLEPGLYFLVRELRQWDALQGAMKDGFAWQKPASCPADLHLCRLVAGDLRAISLQLSCQQAIASDGCFSLGMIANFEEPLQRFGPWFYRRLFWECGMIGQVLYLEAEAAGLRGTGIGCFFDDGVHQLLGLETEEYQSLYHFTIGRPIEDTRLTTLPAYSSSP